MKLEKAIFINRAPFEHLELDFSSSNLTILSGVNGSGKTTIISYIVDSLYELTRLYFPAEFEGRDNKYYRVSSGTYVLKFGEPSIVYLRFKAEDGFWDYIDVRDKCSKEQYDTLINFPTKIQYREFENELKTANNVKHWNLVGSSNPEERINNCLHAYFPAYRYEIPNYLNEPFRDDLEFNFTKSFSGHLSNPIEIKSDLLYIAKWIMDVILDKYLYNQQGDATIQSEINLILNNILSGKVKKNVRFGIGPRSQKSQRIAIMDVITNQAIYPNIFDMSSGEIALVSIFVELIRQADVINKSINNVSGIVLIDEVDKHLHIHLQKDVLPILFSLFPNIQFIVTSHSPFFSIGLEQIKENGYHMIDLDNGGIDCLPHNNHLFKEIYDLVIEENSRYIERFSLLKKEINRNAIPLIITEGSTDWKHIKTALNSLKNSETYKDIIGDLNVEFWEYESAEVKMSCSELCTMCKSFAKIHQARTMIFVADSDEQTTRNELAGSPYKDWGNNVYSICLPIPDFRLATPYICIEYLYNDETIKRKALISGVERRVYLGSEFDEYGHLMEDKSFFCTDRNSCGPNKTRIIDGEEKSRVININDEKQINYALSKSCFAKMIMNKEAPFESVDFSGFIPLIEVIKDIVKEDKQNESDE